MSGTILTSLFRDTFVPGKSHSFEAWVGLLLIQLPDNVHPENSRKCLGYLGSCHLHGRLDGMLDSWLQLGAAPGGTGIQDINQQKKSLSMCLSACLSLFLFAF